MKGTIEQVSDEPGKSNTIMSRSAFNKILEASDHGFQCVRTRKRNIDRFANSCPRLTEIDIS
jgi:hypothetical protein